MKRPARRPKGSRPGLRRLRRAAGGRRALPLIALLLAAAGLLRLGGSGPAIAREMAALAASPAEAESAPACEPPPDLQQVLDSLAKRRARLEEREAAVDERTAALSRAEEQINAKLAELTAAETRLQKTLALADGAAENDVAQLTQVYEKMKPKEASALFEKMEPSFAAGFLARMSPEASARVMAGLTPETAYSISVVLAGRHAGLPKP